MSVTSQVALTGPVLITALPQAIPSGFPFQTGTEIKVLNQGASGATTDPVELTYNSDFTVSGGGYNSANEMQTGTITVVSGGAIGVSVGDYLVIERNVPINQTSTFTSGALTLQQIEQALDKQATLSQEVKTQADRSLHFADGDTAPTVLPKPDRINKYLGFAANGDPVFIAGTDISPDVSSLVVTATGSTTPRALDVRFAEVVNVKDFGAVGDGVINDTTSIAAAKTYAVAGSKTLYFPQGTYITDTITITGAAGLSITGQGKGVSIIKSRTPGQVINVSSSSRVSVTGLTFDGNCTTRTAGAHAVIFDAIQSSFVGNEIINSGEYSFFSGSGSTQIYDLTVSSNLIRNAFADGIHFQYVTRSIISNNIVDASDDDCYSLNHNASGAASDILLIGNYGRARTDLGTNWGRGILLERASSCKVIGNYIENIKQYGLLADAASGTRPSSCTISQNVFKGCCINSGHGVGLFSTTNFVFSDNQVIDPVVAGSDCLEIADWQNLVIQGGYLQQSLDQFARGIHADENAIWPASWDTLTISGVSINMSGASTDSCIYLGPDASVTMNTVIINGVVGKQVVAGDYIVVIVAQTGTLAKLVNNTTATASRLVNPSSSTGVFTVANNN